MKIKKELDLVQLRVCDLPLTLWNDVAARRIELGLTQEELANECGISLKSLERIEDGYVCSVRIAMKLALCLACSFNDLFWFVDLRTKERVCVQFPF